MNPIPTRFLVFTLACYESPTNDMFALTCRSCQGSLDLHQPDSNQSDQFLATCPECGEWYRVWPSTPESGLTILELPEIGSGKVPTGTSGAEGPA